MSRKIREKNAGNVYQSRGKWFARVSVGGKQKSKLLPLATDEASALARAAVLASLVAMLREAEQTEYVETTIKKAAAATDAQLARIVETVHGICAGVLVPKRAAAGSPVASRFRDVARAWTSGDLAKKYPDHVKAKRTADGDAYTLAHVVEVDVGGAKFGDLPLPAIRLEHVDAVMASLPAALQPATRRQYLQAIRKVLGYGVAPLRLLTANIITKEHMPRAHRKLAKGQLRPAEEASVCGCTKAPLLDRLVLGFCHREGTRTGEAVALEWTDINLALGTVDLDENKTDEPRTWVLGDDVRRALEAWRKRNPEARYVFGGDAPHNVHKLAERLRRYIGAEYANVARSELLERSAARIPLRAHDTRGAFITRALACGQTETWVTDRTGHKSSQMVYNYKQTARTEAALGLGWWAPMDRAIPELAAEVAADPKGTSQGGGSNPLESLDKGRSGGMADAPDSKSGSRKGVWVQVPPSARIARRDSPSKRGDQRETALGSVSSFSPRSDANTLVARIRLPSSSYCTYTPATSSPRSSDHRTSSSSSLRSFTPLGGSARARNSPERAITFGSSRRSGWISTRIAPR